MPGAPTAVTATSNANASSVVSWTAPSTGGSAITGYTVTSSPGGFHVHRPAARPSCTVTGLTNGTGYTFTVTATNAAGTGLASAASAAATPAAAPGAPTGVTATPSRHHRSVGRGVLDGPGHQRRRHHGYTVTSTPGRQDLHLGHHHAAPSTGLTNGTSLHLHGDGHQRGRHQSGLGGIQLASSPVPRVPRPPSRPPPTPTPASVVSWTARATGGSPITGYTVTSSPGGKTCTTGGHHCTCTVTGLTNGTAYTFTVTATNAVGTGPASGPSAPATPATVPGAPTRRRPATSPASPSARRRRSSSTGPTRHNGGAAITGYTVTSSPAGGTCRPRRHGHDLHRHRA